MARMWRRARPRVSRPALAGRARTRLRRAVSRVVWPDAAAHHEASKVVCHEWFVGIGGSDRVAARITHVLEPDVTYTFALDRRTIERLGVEGPVVTWRFGRWASRNRRFQRLLPVMALVWRSLDLSGARQVVTSSHACVNAVRAQGAHRTSYCHTPMRYAWEWRLETERVPWALWPLLPAAAAVLRLADRRWSRNVDTYVANSKFVADRIRRAYRRDAVVVHPPVDLDRWRPDGLTSTDVRVGEGESTPGPPLDLGAARPPFVVAGRLVAYKRADLAVCAATRAGLPLLVAGSGPELARLRRLAGPTVDFDEDPDDDRLVRIVRDGRALVFPGVEDFGILPVEAQACGTPVIARREGGATETVIDGVTGVLIDTDDLDVWTKALVQFDESAYDPDEMRRSAARFSITEFDRQLRDVLGTSRAGRLRP